MPRSKLDAQHDPLGLKGAVAVEEKVSQAPSDHGVVAALDGCDRVRAVSDHDGRARAERDINRDPEPVGRPIQRRAGGVKSDHCPVALASAPRDLSGDRSVVDGLFRAAEYNRCPVRNTRPAYLQR